MTILLSTAIIAYLVTFAIVSYKNRYYGLLWLAFALPTYGIRFSLLLPTTLLEVTIGILAVITIIQEYKSIAGLFKKIPTLTNTQKWLLAATATFFVSATISIFTSPDIVKSLGIWRAYFVEPLVVAGVALATIKNERQVRGVIWAMAGTVATISLVAIFQKFTGWNIPQTWLEERRVTGIFSYPNAVGLYIAPIIPLIIALTAYYTRQQKKVHVIMSSLVVVLGIIAILFAKTEAALIALTGALGFFGILWGKKTRYAVLLSAVLLGVLLFISQPLQDLAKEKLLLKDWSGFVRTTIWKETSAMLSDHWLTGAGLAGYQEVFKPYHKTTFIEIFLYPHNIVMNFWSETGLYGVISFFAMIGSWLVMVSSAFIRSWRERLNQNTISVQVLSLGLICSVIAILIHGLVDVPFFKNDLAAQFFLLIALSVVIYNESRRLNTSAKQ